MRSFFRLRHSSWGVALILLLLIGCGAKGPVGVKLEGKIVKNGEALTVGQGETISVSFLGKDAEGKDTTVGATVSADGSFVVNSIPPGKYKLRVSMASGSNDAEAMKKLAEHNKQFEAGNAKLECDITADANQKLTVDTAKGIVTK